MKKRAPRTKPEVSLLLKLAGKYRKVKPVKKIDVEKIRSEIEQSWSLSTPNENVTPPAK